MTEQQIDLEEIAAFIDGRLSGEPRARMIKLLAESEAAYEVYIETLRFQEEQAPERARVLWFPRWKLWVPAAAAAAIVVAVGIRAARDPEVEVPASAALVASLAERADLGAALGPAWDQRTWSVTRGGPARLGEPHLAFRLGVRAVDLHVALALGQAERAARLTTELLDWLSDVEMSQAVAAQYSALRTRLATEPTGPLANLASEIERDLASLLARSAFALGRWSGAAELAAGARDAAFFTTPSTAPLFEAVGQLGLSDADAAALRRIAALSRGDLGDAQFQELQALARQIIERNAG